MRSKRPKKLTTKGPPKVKRGGVHKSKKLYKRDKNVNNGESK